MKRLREFIFDESLSEEEDDDEHDMGEENFRHIANGDPVELEHDANKIHRFLQVHLHIEIKTIHTLL
jgi:hypothetical protein